MGFRQASTIRPEQQALLGDVTRSYGDVAPVASGFLQNLGESSAQIVSDWQNDFATPVMNMWKQTIAPLVREGFNRLPGSMYSKSAYKGLQMEAEQFMSGSVMPTLFSALENMKARRPQYGQIYAGMLGQSGALATTQTIQNYYKDQSWRKDLEMDIENYSGIAGEAAGVIGLLK